ncbi:hypothetical protein [uncultured Pseudokineococcus sp.]|uniref:hypothetical protein n=1 Tax=uncultured Pseudokineococcus sp. TaxID=1642928 RepID=UPI0026359680|nr:hypothetical protein [uncultured Pseudokineococcus sp.]
MPRTTTRRAAATGLGALAATTALALAAPSATAASSAFVLDPGQDVAFSAFGTPLDVDQADELDATPVDLLVDGRVVVDLPDLAVDHGTVEAVLVPVEAFEDAYESGADPRLDKVDLRADLEPQVDGTVLTVDLPADDPALVDVDDVYLLVDGLEVLEFPEAPSFEVLVPLDLDPTERAADLVRSPARVDATYLDAVASVDEPVAAQVGETFEVVLPGGSSLRELGVADLDGLDGFVIPLTTEGDDDGVDLELESLADSFAVLGAEGPDEVGTASGADLAQALAEAAGEHSAGSLGGATALAVEDGDESEDATATVRASEDLEPGTYLMVLFPPTTDDAVSVVALGELELAAAPAPAPAPTPTVTVTAPAPAPAAPSGQNPGLRSNTGVEGGGADGGLVAVGAGLLAVATVGGAAALRTGRRGRA